MPTVIRGLTWDHPRAIEPLKAANAVLAARRPDLRVDWDTQPLAGFEARPLGEIVERYDLVVFDHPHVGEAAQEGLLRPLDGLCRALGLVDGDFAGPSLDSYRHDGVLWGLPIDAACQVACFRPDLLSRLGQPAPICWPAMLELGERARRHGLWLAAGLAGVHSLMMLLTLCANQDAPLARCSGPAFPDRAAAFRALEAMRAFTAFCPPDVLDWNSIALQDAMRDRDDLVFCPAVFGFSTYARPSSSRPSLRYGALPGLDDDGPGGSTLGGAGIGISARSRVPKAAEDVVALLVSPELQAGVMADAGGQPAHRTAWSSPLLDGAVGEFYSRTRDTIEAAWVRPRFAGYLAFQRAGGPLVEACLRGTDPDRTLDQLDEAWFAAWGSKT